MKNFKKAAMFGLDARIALAIFGALSVVSGAALYSAIQQAKVVAIVADLTELNKASEQYYLDTGEELPMNTSYITNILDLVENDSSVANWKGPYTSLAKDVTYSYRLNYPLYGRAVLFRHSIADAWGGTEGSDLSLPTTCTGAQEPCAYYATVEFVPYKLAEKVDEYVDGTVDYRSGRVRIRRLASGISAIFLQGMISQKNI